MTTYLAAPIADVFAWGDESIVLLDARCLRLNQVAAAIVAALDQPRSIDEIAEILEAQFGPAPDGTEAAVRHHVSLLVEFGAVVCIGEES